MISSCSANAPLLHWLCAGPFSMDVSDRYTDNYCVPFAPYQDIWNQANQAGEQICHACEGDAFSLLEQRCAWHLVRLHPADRQLTWAKFGASATLMVTFLYTTIIPECAGLHQCSIHLQGAAQLWINGKAVWTHQEIGRTESWHQFDVDLREGENEIVLMLFNVHLHCLNSSQLSLDCTCKMQTRLFLMVEGLRTEIDECLNSAYLSCPVALAGEQVFLRVSHLPSHGKIVYTVCSPLGDTLQQAVLSDTCTLIPTDPLPPGDFLIDIGYTSENMVIQGPQLRLTRVALMDSLPDTDFEGRKRFLLSYYAKHSHQVAVRAAAFVDVAKFSAGHPEWLDEEQLNRVIDYINARYDCADFALHGLLRFYWKYHDHPMVPPSLSERMRRCILDFKYWVDEPGKSLMFTRSENHEILFYSAEYLAGMLFPDQTFTNSRQNGLFHAMKGRMNAEHWIREKGYYGFTEWHSNTYYEEDMLAMLDLYDFGEQNGLLRVLARQLLDMIVLLIASNSSGGIMATTHGRCYEASLMYPVVESMSRINWLLFAAPQKLNQSISIGAIALADSTYTPIRCGEKIAQAVPLETHTRMGLFRWQNQPGVICSTYRTAHYMVSGLVLSKAGEHGAQVHAGQALLNNAVPVFVTCFADFSPTTRPSYFGGQYRIPKTVAYRNLLAFIYHIEGDLGYTHCYFPINEFDEVRRTDRWRFARSGLAYIAVYCSTPVTETSSGIYHQRELLTLSKDTIWLMELGDADTWGSFDAFIDTIASSQIRQDQDGLLYHSPSQGELALSWSEDCTLGGKSLSSPNAPLMDNSFAHAEYGSGKIVLKDGSVIDFFA